MSEQQEKYTVTVERFDEKGFGESIVWRKNELGNPKKLRLIIPESIPGEKVDVTVEEPHLRWQRQGPDDVLTPHEDRVEAPCPHFGRCGGCVWQHVSYERQLEEKLNMIKGFITEQGFSPEVVRSPIGMDEPWYYRNKMEFTFSPEGELGLHEQGNFRKIVLLETCLIMDPDKKDVVLEIADWVKAHGYPGYDKDTHEGLFRHVMVRTSLMCILIIAGIAMCLYPIRYLKHNILLIRIHNQASFKGNNLSEVSLFM